MASSDPSGYVPNVHHPDIMRSILQGIVETGDVLGPAGPGRTILAVTVDNWLIDELAALDADLEDREPEPDENDALQALPWAAVPWERQVGRLGLLDVCIAPARVSRAVTGEPCGDHRLGDILALPVAPAHPPAVRALIGEIADDRLILDQLDQERLRLLAAGLTRVAEVCHLGRGDALEPDSDATHDHGVAVDHARSADQAFGAHNRA